jgi:lactate dehydrogenase-like 2-hydroxyacid dehydrogenase
MAYQLLISRKLPAAVEKRAAERYSTMLNAADEPLGRRIVDMSSGCRALLVSSSDRLDAQTIHALDPSVAIVATFSVGYSHIDIVAAAQRGIVVTNTPQVLTESTADIAMLLILGACRRAGEGHELVRGGRWPEAGHSLTFMLGVDLRGLRMGILGMGRVGQALAHRARAFGLEVHYHNRNRLDPHQESGAIFHARLESLLAISEVLSINCPSSAETHRLLDASRLDLLPPGSVVVNTARGDIVDDVALIERLKSGRIFSAGLDVFDGEPNVHPTYRELPNVFLLPHLGSATQATRTAMGFRALDNIDAVLEGRAPRDRVV